MTQRVDKLTFEYPDDPNRSDLSEQERRFADHYIRHLNAAAAARYAGVSNEVAAECGWRLAMRPRVRTYIATFLEARKFAEGLSSERVLLEIATIATVNMLDFVRTGADDNPEVDWSKVEADPRLGAAVQSVETETRIIGEGDDAYTVTRVKLKLHDKLKALNMAAQHLDLLNEVRAAGELGRGIGRGAVQGVAEVAIGSRDMARRIAFALSLGLREEVVIEQEPVEAFEDLT